MRRPTPTRLRREPRCFALPAMAQTDAIAHPYALRHYAPGRRRPRTYRRPCRRQASAPRKYTPPSWPTPPRILPEELRGMPPQMLYPMLLDQLIDRRAIIIKARAEEPRRTTPAVKRQVAPGHRIRHAEPPAHPCHRPLSHRGRHQGSV